MVKLCENTNVYGKDVQFHQTLKYLKESKFQGLEPRGGHSSAGSMEQAGRQVENWFQLFPCCPRLRCARQCTVLSDCWAVTSLWLKRWCEHRGVKQAELWSMVWNLESTGPHFSQYEQWCLDFMEEKEEKWGKGLHRNERWGRYKRH